MCKELCVWMHSCARADANPPKTHEDVVTFHGSQHSSCGGRRGKCCLVAAASFPSETARQPPGSLLHLRGSSPSTQTPSHVPAAGTAARWVVGGTGVSALLPPGVSLQLAQNCPRAGTDTVESEEDVNLLTIFAVCISRQMKLINKGRNVTLSKVLTSKSKYLHRCAGCCQLLGIAMFLDQFMAPTAPAPFLHCSGPAAPWGAPGPGGGQGLQHRGRREGLSQDAQEGDVGDLGCLHRRGGYFSPVVSEPYFFLPQG